ncbi:Outer membrane translocation and assembly module TamA [Flaviramulus basaltis]|uniref:Outer membrane translocation and assembly module TamA n=1 Tax=Flaviramulus basaltis TaxID=369401 RepID=A0A1K2IA49_9FLAO|nr:POTRA domain-containing protein [Flaviramulus basaltis]SFZ89271.1 Outer membrane translocation and assembly module TamA [Flaviramulus basaltis]
MQKTPFLYLIICILFSTKLFCQSLHLKIQGKTIYETRIIDSLNYLNTHKNYKSINNEVDSIQKALYKKGFIENELKFLRKINDSTFSAEFYLKKKFNTIYIYYKKTEVDASIIEMISKDIFDDYFKLNFSEIENTLTFINSKISEKGRPFSKLYLSNIRIRDNSNIEGSLIIESTQQKRSINNIVVKGYEKFPQSYLKHYLKIKPKQIFDLNKIKNKINQLNNLIFAKEIKSPEVLFSKDSTTLYLYLEKTKSNAFDGFLGFGTNEVTSKLEFDGYLNLNLVNNLNFGESFRLLYKSDENDQKTFEVDVSLPYLFKSPIGADFLLRIFKRDSSFTTTNQSAKLHYQINSKHKIYAGIIATESNNLLRENFNSTISNYKTQYLTIAYQFLKPQFYNVLFPTKSKLYFETGFGGRKTSNSTERQNQITIDAFNIFNLNQKNSIYFRINGANLISDTYFENELLRFGGINSIRGFEENSLFSNLYGLVNTEYRFQLNNAIYIHSIIDAAYFENKIINTKEKLYGYGFGFGILTKAGLFKFNYANGKNENIKFKLSNSKIHLSLTTIF